MALHKFMSSVDACSFRNVRNTNIHKFLVFSLPYLRVLFSLPLSVFFPFPCPISFPLCCHIFPFSTEKCDEALASPLPHTAFTSSSVFSNGYAPGYAKLNRRGGRQTLTETLEKNTSYVHRLYECCTLKLC